MKIVFANHRFEGERVIETSPAISNRISSEWYLRPKLYTGRALTADTLISNTKHHIRHMQLFGRHISGGVIQGLTLTSYVKTNDGDAGDAEQWLRLTAGMGITSWGDDITLPATADIMLDNVPIWEGQDPPAENPPRGAGIFVLQPIEILDESAPDEDSQCQWDEDGDAFSDEQIVDGCRLVFIPWPGDVLGPVPRVQFKQFRNQLVYRIFDYEKAHPYVMLPWEHIGVPIGLAYITINTGNILFIDRNAVVRKGGAPLSTKIMLPVNGTPFLWESRIQQFIGHMYDIRQTVDIIPNAHTYFEVLPPVGVIPKQALDLDNMSTGFFPSQFIVDASPIPEEQLEPAMNASAGLEPIDLHQPEKIKLLVPVPQAVYEPDLLKKEGPDPLFLETLRRLVREIRQYLEDRKYLRDMAVRVIGAIDQGQVPSFVDDADIIPDEGKFTVSIGRHDNITDYGLIATDTVKDLHYWINKYAPGVSDTVISQLIPTTGNPPVFKNDFKGLENFILELKNNIQKTEDILNSGYVKAESDMYRLRQVLLGNATSSRLATSPALGQIVGGQTTQPSSSDVEALFKTTSTTDETEATTKSKSAAIASSFSRSNIVSAKKTLIQRIYESPSVEVKNTAVKTKSSIFDLLVEIPLDIEDEVPVIERGNAVIKNEDYDAILESLEGDSASLSILEGRSSTVGEWVILSTTSLSEEEEATLNSAQKVKVNQILSENTNRVSFKDIKASDDLRNNIREGIFDPDPDGDEADYFAAGATSLDHGLNAMRIIEKRLDDYKKTMTQSQKVLSTLQSNASNWKDRLGETDEKIEALRHDALVTRSLFEEELSRLSEINERRRAILDTYATTLVFVRPRLVDPRLDVSSVPLYGEYVNPVPACLAEDFEATGELEDMLDVFREVPVSWLTDAKGLVKLIDNHSGIVDMIKQAKNRTYKIIGDAGSQTASYQIYNTNEYGKSINKIISANRQSRQTFAKQKASMDLSSAGSKTWLQLAEEAQTQVSLADLIEKGSGATKLAVKAAEIMENLEDVAVCLYHLCDGLESVIKLQWANLISVYDKPVDLRYLDALPSFDKLDFTSRRDMQNMVDWLFSQVDTGIEKAGETMNDLVRVCILLACHAPVSTLIKGYVETPSTGKVGDFLDVVVGQGQIKVGMAATVFTQNEVAVRGIVTDVSQNATRIKVTRAKGNAGEFTVDKGSQAKFASGKFTKSMS